MDFYLQLLISAPPILLALTLHEFAHAFVADRLGDPTPRNQGRLTLNPLAHLDPIGTILLFIARFGWAKPVQVDPRNFQNPQRGMMIVAAAGPASNLALALIFGIIYQFMQGAPPETRTGVILQFIISYSVVINLVLAFFNLLPIPPLDGSKIIRAFLPETFLPAFSRLESFGPFLLLGIIVLGQYFNIAIVWTIIGPFVSFFSILFTGVDLS